MTDQALPPQTRITDKVPAVDSLAALLQQAYSIKRKRLVVTKKDQESISQRPRIDVAQREDLLNLAGTDRILQRTRELLLLSLTGLRGSAAASELREFVGQVLRAHPAFRAPSLEGVLENLPDSSTDEEAVLALSRQSFEGLTWAPGLTPLKGRQAQQCRTNAIQCLILWMRETRGLKADQVHRLLHLALWAPAAGAPGEIRLLKTLLSAREHSALGAIQNALAEKMRERALEAIAAREALTKLESEVKDLKHRVEGLTEQVEREQKNGEALKRQLDNETRRHDDDKAHLRNQNEEMRGRLLRRLRQEVNLLDEGLQALRRDPPKVHVMLDHAERAIDGLKSEIEQLRGQDK